MYTLKLQLPICLSVRVYFCLQSVNLLHTGTECPTFTLQHVLWDRGSYVSYRYGRHGHLQRLIATAVEGLRRRDRQHYTQQGLRVVYYASKAEVYRRAGTASRKFQKMLTSYTHLSLSSTRLAYQKTSRLKRYFSTPVILAPFYKSSYNASKSDMSAIPLP